MKGGRRIDSKLSNDKDQKTTSSFVIGNITNVKVKDSEQPELPWMISSTILLAPLVEVDLLALLKVL